MEQLARAVGMFAVTNVDDLVLLALFFGQAKRHRDTAAVVLGQYLGFCGILAASVVGALGAGLLPDGLIRYLGVLPLLLGLRAAWQVWHSGESEPVPTAPGVLSVAAVTLANGGDNIGVYVPVFATGGLLGYVVVFLALVGVWCAAGRFFATRPAVARALSRWGHFVLPVVLITIGVLILVGG